MKKYFVLAWISFFLLSSTLVLAAPNKIFRVAGTRVTFQDSGGTVTFPINSTGNAAGKYSNRFDKSTISGATATQQPFDWDIDCTFQVNVNPNVVGNFIEVYVIKWATSAIMQGGNFSTTGTTLVTDKRKNITLVGVLILDQTTQNASMSGVWTVPNGIWEPYFSLAAWNASGATLNSSGNSCGATPYTLEMQVKMLPEGKLNDLAT
jgi:hypothetical protein